MTQTAGYTGGGIEGGEEMLMVCPPGIEPGTYSLEGCCSILLSYGHMIQQKKGAVKTPLISPGP